MAAVPRTVAYLVEVAVRCALGVSSATAAAAVRAGVSGISEHPFLRDANGEPVFSATEPSLDPALPVPGRIARMATECLNDLAATVAADVVPDIHESPVSIALPEVRPGFEDSDSTMVCKALEQTSARVKRTRVVRRAGEGHAGAIAAISYAVKAVEAGREGIVFAGGADSYLDSRTVTWLDADRRLARPDIRSGLIPGEGAAFVAIASAATCERYGLKPLARIRGIACTHETREANSYTGLLGEALGNAIARAAEGIQPPDHLIADTYGDINGELARSHDWGLAVLRTSTLFADATAYVMTAGQCGDVGAATGALGSALAVEAWRFKHATGPLAMVWAGSWAGLRGAMVLESESA